MRRATSSFGWKRERTLSSLKKKPTHKKCSSEKKKKTGKGFPSIARTAASLPVFVKSGY